MVGHGAQFADYVLGPERVSLSMVSHGAQFVDYVLGPERVGSSWFLFSVLPNDLQCEL